MKEAKKKCLIFLLAVAIKKNCTQSTNLNPLINTLTQWLKYLFIFR